LDKAASSHFAHPRRSTETLEAMAIVSLIFTAFLVTDVLFTTIRFFRRRRLTNADGTTTVETKRARRGRVLGKIGLHLLAWTLLVGIFLAILYFGPLRPVHEWFT
jgi:hypothetical protein